MSSPKRKTPGSTFSGEAVVKRHRTNGVNDVQMISNVPSDSLIDHAAAIAYWSSQEPTDAGVLGGFPQVSRVDLQGSTNFLAKLRRHSTMFQGANGRLKRVVDCGAGIGRITKGFLSKIAETVDVVEPVKSFSDQVKDEAYIGAVYNVGLESWFPEGLDPYDLIWNQWCLNQLTDKQVVAYLKRLPPVLSPGGWIIVKENISNHDKGEDVYDGTDSSVTRTDDKFRRLFAEARLKIVSTEVQRGMPKGLYAVRAYALVPR